MSRCRKYGSIVVIGSLNISFVRQSVLNFSTKAIFKTLGAVIVSSEVFCGDKKCKKVITTFLEPP